MLSVVSCNTSKFVGEEGRDWILRKKDVTGIKRRLVCSRKVGEKRDCD